MKSLPFLSMRGINTLGTPHRAWIIFSLPGQWRLSQLLFSFFLSCWVSPPSYDSLNSKQTNKTPRLSTGAGLEPGRSELAFRWHRVFPSFSALSSHSLRRWHEFRVPAFSLWHLRAIKGIVMLPLRDQGGVHRVGEAGPRNLSELITQLFSLRE